MTTRIVQEGDTTCYYDRAKKHCYEINTNNGRIAVDADSRTQAESIAKRYGHEVHDMNMVG